MIYIYYVLMILMPFIVALAQINFKVGASKIDFKIPFYFNLKNWHLIIGIALFAIAPILI